MTKKLTALLAMLLAFSFAHAETIVVTSNADSGPGTLRGAIENAAANGTGETDYIHFNIPIADFKERIINLLTELPALTSNLIIDGTTQPGEAYATTDAKICIKMDIYAPSFSGFKIEHAINIEVYGFYIYYSYILFGDTPPRSDRLYGISLANAFNIKIGAPGKGNVINGVEHGIYSNSDSCRNIVIQSNYLGLGAYYVNFEPWKEIAEGIIATRAAITLANVKDITIGGLTEEEGNMLGVFNPLSIDSKYTTGNGYIRVQHNYFNLWYDRKTVLNRNSSGYDGLSIGRSHHNPIDYHAGHQVDYQLFLLDNNILLPARFSFLSTPFTMQRNQFYWDFRGGNHETKCVIENCTGGGLIGGEDETNQNIFSKKESEDFYYALIVFDCGPVTILKNKFECNSGSSSTTIVQNAVTNLPFAQVDKTTAASVQGRATPNCRIDLYYDDECNACEGKQYVATIRSDASGNWSYTGAITGTILAIVTDSRGYSSQFSTPTFNYEHQIVKEPSCGKANGSIMGITSEGAEAYFWINELTRDTVGRTIDLHNVGAGFYLLLARHGTNCFQAVIEDYNLHDGTVSIQRGFQEITHPVCGGSNGSVHGYIVQSTHDSKTEWKDAQGNVVGTEANISGLAPGTYTLSVTDTVGGCSDSETVVLTNQSGPLLKANNIKITAASCGASNGSIKNITITNATGEAFLQWLNEQGTILGNTFDLTDVPGGKYRLQFKDESACDTITTAYYTVGGASTITLDTSNLNIKPSECRYASGTIEGIQVTGATSYEWVDAAGTIVSQAKDPGFLYSGNYTLIARNESGCEKRSEPFYIPVKPGLGLPIQLQVRVTDSHCSEANGRVQVLNFPEPEQYTFRWVDSLQPAQNISTLLNLENIGAGRYYLYAKDAKSCEQKVLTAYLRSTSSPALDEALVHVTDDLCSQRTGKIEGLNLVPGTGAAPFTYSWVDESNAPVGNGLNLANQTAGRYRLIIKDQFDCAASGNWHTIRNGTKNYTPPAYAAQTIFRNTAATVSVQNFQPGTYQLFQNPMGGTPLQQNETGVFTTGNLPADTTFYIRIKTGSCESGLTPVFIKVVDDTKVFVPTGFTPNKDGKNDDIKPLVLGLFTLEYFTVYDRWGRIVFTSGDLSKGWNGFIKGSEAPIGVYVWLLKGKDFRGNTIQQKGTFTLLR